MIGLIALAILSFWGFVSYKLSAFLVKKVKSNFVRHCAQAILCVLLCVSPVADEIVGGFQFRSLCNKDSMPFVNEEKARGKTLLEDSSSTKLTGYILPIEKFTFFFKEANTNETVVSWIQYRATGGWLAQTINFNSVDSPYTFNGSCSPKYSGMKIVKNLNINLQSNAH